MREGSEGEVSSVVRKVLVSDESWRYVDTAVAVRRRWLFWVIMHPYFISVP